MCDPMSVSTQTEPVITSDVTVYEDTSHAHFEAHRVSVEFPDGKHVDLHYAQTADDRCGAVCLIREGQKIVLARHWRAAINASQLELPRGMGEPGETPEQTAVREAAEETGLRTCRPQVLQYIHADSGVLRDRIAIVELSVDRNAPAGQTDGELEDWQWMDISQIRRMMRRGALTDSISLAALGVLLLRRQSADGFLDK